MDGVYKCKRVVQQVKEALTLRVEEGMTQVRGLQDRLTQLLNEKDALEGSLKQANDEKLLLKVCPVL